MGDLRRTIFIIFTFCFLFSANSQAQFARFGLRGGILYTDWIGEKVIDDKITYDGKVGAFIGFYSVNDITSNWSLEYGLNISWKGFKMNGQYFAPGVNLGADLTNESIYIDIPLAVRMFFGDNSPSGFFVQAGAQFSILTFNKINGSVVYNGTPYYGDPDNNADELHRFDISLYPGVGYQFDSGLNFQLFYEYGLLNIVKDEDYLGIKSAHNSVFRLQVGIDL